MVTWPCGAWRVAVYSNPYHEPQVCSAAPLLLTYDARTRTISSWSSHSGDPVQISAWSSHSSRELGGCREGDGPIVDGGVSGGGKDVGGGNGCGAGDAGDAVGYAVGYAVGDAARTTGDVGDAAEEERGARPLLSVYGSQAVLALGSKLMWLGAPHLPQAWLRRQRECETQLLQAARMQLPLATDSFVCKLVRAWLQLGPPADSPATADALTLRVVASGPSSVAVVFDGLPSGQVRQAPLEHPLGALLRARVGAFVARFAASRGGTAADGCGAGCGVNGGGGGGGDGGGGDDGGSGGSGDCGGGGGSGDGGNGEAAAAVKALHATTTMLTACVAASLPQLHGHGRSVKKVRTIVSNMATVYLVACHTLVGTACGSIYLHYIVWL